MIQELDENITVPKKKQCEVCSENGKSIFYEEDDLCHRHFAVSLLTSDAPGQSHSVLPGEEKLSLKLCDDLWNTEPCP